MIAEIPVLNIIVSLIYLSLAGASMFLLKLASKPRLALQSYQANSDKQQSRKIYYRMGVSWLKKYSIIGSAMISDKKYLAKQLLILSVYGVACLKINKITLWPVALLTFLLPLLFFAYEIAIKLQANSQKTQDTIKNEVQIDIQPGVSQGTKVVSVNQNQHKPKHQKHSRNIFQIAIISTIAFIAVILDLETVMILDNSISNSGQLNIVSVACIVLLDQLLLRPISGLLLIIVIKLLEVRQLISLHQNTLVSFLCEQMLIEEYLQEEERRVRAELESTQAHLKNKQEEQLRDTNVPIKPDHANMVYLDFQHIQPQQYQQASSPHQAFSHSSKDNVDQEEVYLTTPEKELFQVDVFSNNYQTIVNTYLCNKENAQSQSNNSRITYEDNHKLEVNCFEELILTKDQPLQNIQNIQPSFKTQAQMTEEQRKKAQNKRKNKRVLKLTGNSPYLQYLPNMLKNVRKGAQTTGVAATPKVGQLNFR